MSEKLRKSIKHIHDLSCGQLREFVTHGTHEAVVTEKTDGSAFEMGRDAEGFYTRTSTSPKMRGDKPYQTAAIVKFGAAYDPKISGLFDWYHHLFAARLQDIDEEWFLRGELFPVPFVPKDIHNRVCFVGTNYDAQLFGLGGGFVIHSQLTQNAAEHIVDRVANLLHDGNSHNSVWIYDDMVGKQRIAFPPHVVSIARELPQRLTSTNSAAKIYMRMLQEVVQLYLEQTVTRYSPKWGPETEGYVFHFDTFKHKIKVIDPEFKKRKTENGW